MPWWGWLLIGLSLGALGVFFYFWKLLYDMWSGW